MKQLFIILALATGAQAAAPVVALVAADMIDYSTARITVRTTAVLSAPRLRVHYGYAHNDTPFIMGDAVAPGATYVCVPVDLAFDPLAGFLPDRTECGVQTLRIQPSTKVYVSLEFDDGGTANTTWGCSGGAITEGTISGLTCGAGETRPFFTSLPMPGPWYMPFPAGIGTQQPTVPSYTFPVISAVEGTNTFTIADDCSDMPAKFALAQGAVATQNVQIRFPYGPTHPCPAFTPVNNSGPYFAVYRSKAPDDMLPPPNGRVAEHHVPYMSVINPNASGAAVFAQAAQSYSIFMGLYLTLKNLYPTVDEPILKIVKSQQGTVGASAWQFYTETPLPPSVVNQGVVLLAGVPYLNEYCGPGVNVVNSVLAADSFQVYCGAAVVDPTPDTTTLGRGLVPVGTQRLANIVPGGCAGGLAKVSLAVGSAWGLSDNNVIHIVDVKGIDGGINNRGWRVQGTVNENTCLQASTGLTGTYVPNSGIMAMEGSSMINAYTEGATQIWFDRVITQGREFPNRLFASITLTGCNSCGVLNSAMYGIGGWLAIDPVTNKYVVYNTSPGSTTGYALEVTSAQNLLVQNNYMEGNGILIFAQDNKIDTGWPIAANHTIRGNEFVTPPSRLAGGPASDHMYHAHRHHIEYKSGIAVRIDGNIFRGAYADELPNGNAIAISVRQQTGTHLNTYVDGLTHAGVTRDFTIVNNYFHTNAGVLKIAYDSDTRRYGTEPVRRIEFSNNIIHNQDWYHMRSLPNSNSYNEVIVSYSSGEMIGANPSHGMIIRNNTQIHQNGMSPIWLGLAGWNIPWSQVIVLDNLFQDNRTGNYPPGGMGMGVITWAGTVKDSWQHISSVYTPSGPAGDPNSFWAGNMFVGGSENNQEYGFWDYSCYPSAGAFCNWSQAEVDAYWGTGSNALGTYVSSTQTFAADTPTGRENEVGYHSIPTGNYRAKTDAPVQPANGKSYAGIGVGANMNVIMQAAQRHSNLRALTVRATSADIGWTAPVAGAACYLSCPTCTATRQLNNAATLDRKSTLSGLTAATNYSVSVTCGNLDELLTFRTP